MCLEIHIIINIVEAKNFNTSDKSHTICIMHRYIHKLIYETHDRIFKFS